jgi:hypothetical protein
MPHFEITASFNNNDDRNHLRMSVVEQLSKELCGKGKGEKATHYIYYVETLSNGNRIYLKRPAWLHNGFDFVVCVENTNFNPKGRFRNNPSHEDIFNDLVNKKNENYTIYKQLHKIIDDTYNCRSMDLLGASKLKFRGGHPCDLIIGSLKWLFIEQDIRYWNYSGREMLWNGIKGI